MKLYKIRFIKFEIFPFYFIENWKCKAAFFKKKIQLKRYFKKLNWSEKQMWELTKYCGSLDEAVHKLCLELTDDFRLFPLAKKLINDGYERGWK